MQLVTGTHWLEPLLPSDFPSEILSMAEQLPYQAGKLAGMLPPETTTCVGGLLRVTSSFYSNLIEGQFTEPVSLAPRAPKRSRKELTELAVAHIGAQEAFERAILRYSAVPWREFFSPSFVARIHCRLFESATEEQLRLADGNRLVPGQLRDAAERDVMVGQHAAPAWTAVTPMLNRMQQVYGSPPDARTRLLAVMAYHHRLAWVHPFADGNGRVVRLLTHLQLHKLNLSSPLWSFSRGLARRQEQYYARLANADQPRRGDLDGRGQLTQAGLFEFVGFMLDTCLDQMRYIEAAMQVGQMRERLEKIFAWEPRINSAGVKPEVARALHVLLTQGKVGRADFKVFTGLGERTATDQLRKLVELGLVDSPTPKAREIFPALPVWFAQQLFPDLHQRLGPAL
ncbi:Fic family protein [Azotobacter beijerinckii]|uniref:Fic family protein n=1 Tax=Azotobacter beijerinckii TaxID=170623 RepID=A0A1H6W2K1_9GAMM|nr:Fic family protein [Azotobacter beijerinckii]SEJ06742.1 Fic family protein [Azotobacter beijerinckii]